MNKLVGEIADIHRYPIKSFAGERLDSCELETYGVRGDRYAAFYDDAKEGWWRYITARNIPNMLNYRARFVDGDIEVTTPDGRRCGWDDSLLDELQRQTDTRLTMSRLHAPHPQPEHPQLLSVDGASVLLITDASLKRLETLWGKPVDPRRFRANFLVTLEGDANDGEAAWLGSRLAIGDAELQVDEYCERCVMTTMDPDTQRKDPTLLKLLNREFGVKFGVYASVVKTGSVRIGDQVELINGVNE